MGPCTEQGAGDFFLGRAPRLVCVWRAASHSIYSLRACGLRKGEAADRTLSPGRVGKAPDNTSLPTVTSGGGSPCWDAISDLNRVLSDLLTFFSRVGGAEVDWELTARIAGFLSVAFRKLILKLCM